MTFTEWLALRHPEVRLSRLQGFWADVWQSAHRLVHSGNGKGSGKTFFLRLWIEYLHEQDRGLTQSSVSEDATRRSPSES